MTSLSLSPISLKDANNFVAEHHRHHRPVVGHKFSLGCRFNDEIVGVAIVSRPINRYLDDSKTLEVTRLCTNGTRNACSFLYSAAWRVAKNLGYKKIITYILESESGVSLQAAGWTRVTLCEYKPWKPRRQLKLFYEENPEIAVKKWRWEKQI
jgi:hypothetical protein